MSNNIEKWREHRFGLFIHWGIYSAMEGFWNGKETFGIGEWIQAREKIPLEEYAKNAEGLTLSKFNAKELVAFAKQVGFKYIVLTSKHHDGFAMFDSSYCDYNVVKRSPAHIDPVKELAQECEKQGVDFGLYYSQALDWQDPNAYGNTWDYDEEKKNYRIYLDGKCKHQLKEILTQYGDLLLIWFDVPFGITVEESQEIKDYVKSLQPNCLVSGRISSVPGMGDYGSFRDNQLPKGKVIGDWETPATLNDTWGYKRTDHNWKKPEEIVELLVDLVSKGANLLLNIGPKASGEIPKESIDILTQVGKWMQVNGKAVYGTTQNPFLTDFEWGCVSQKDNKLYLYQKKDAQQLVLNGLRTKVRSAKLLPDTVLKFEQYIVEDDCNLVIHVPPKGMFVNVIELELDGEVSVVDAICQQMDNSVILPAYLAKIEEKRQAESTAQNKKDTSVEAEKYNLNAGKEFIIDVAGTTNNWFDPDNMISWEFEIFRPCKLEVKIKTLAAKSEKWVGGHEVKVTCNDQTLLKVLKADEVEENPQNRYFEEAISNLGCLNFDQPGKFRLSLKSEKINAEDSAGLCVSEIILK